MGCMLAWLLAAVSVGPTQESPCSPGECLREIQQHTVATRLEASPHDLPGIWKRGSGLSGRLLYLFENGEYVHTEWADVMPERIFDKGTWRVLDSSLALSSDIDATWSARWDQRYLLLRGGGSTDPILFGLDRSMLELRYFVSQQPASSVEDLVQAIGLHHTPWRPAESKKTRTRLMAEAWHPGLLVEGK